MTSFQLGLLAEADSVLVPHLGGRDGCYWEGVDENVLDSIEVAVPSLRTMQGWWLLVTKSSIPRVEEPRATAAVLLRPLSARQSVAKSTDLLGTQVILTGS